MNNNTNKQEPLKGYLILGERFNIMLTVTQLDQNGETKD